MCLEIRTNFAITADRKLINLSGRRLLCHCKRFQQCHADAIIAKFAELYPGVYDRERADERVSTSEELNLMATLREEPSSDEGSTADEGIPDKGSGWLGSAPRCVSEWATQPVTYATVKDSFSWSLASCFKTVPSVADLENRSAHFGTSELLMNLALGRVQENPFCEKHIQDLKRDVTDKLERAGLELQRDENDRRDVPIDFRYLDLLLKAAEDPEVGLGQFSQGVRVGPSVRMPRLPALYKPKRKWRLAAQTDSSNYLEEEEASWPESCWRSNYPSLRTHRESQEGA